MNSGNLGRSRFTPWQDPLCKQKAKSQMVEPLFAGSPIRPLDLQIASIAALNGLIHVTSNTRELTRISGLQVEDWSV